ncbi:hypothetical protein LDO32_02595 [Luteimonas sp. Y-2-2-4F]|nr:hypothetical protein [Luteimonas sp. Y-2-2-4F]MCD9030622.1 hypothetical protein [Luteimonas sp. Y-2-2-4F]
MPSMYEIYERFPDAEAAARAFDFFFGEAAGEAVRRRGSAVVPEFTGVWHRTLQ